MLRTVLTAILLASATAACGGGGSGPKVVAGAPAGDVTEVSGMVTATRDGKTRPLAVGDVVSGDDVVETGADGRVAIQLRHNLVPWTLGPGKKETVSASLAWKAPRATQTAAGPTGERSGAAGRHAEREAADTSATAAAGGAAATEEVAEKAKADEPAPAAATAPAPPEMPAPKMAVAEPTPPPPPPPPGPGGAAPHDEKTEEKISEVGDSFGAGGLGLTGTGEGGGGSGEGRIGLGTGGGGSIGGNVRPQPPKPMVRVFAAKGGLETAVVTRVVRSRNARLTACVQPDVQSTTAPARAMVRLKIRADGKVDEVQVSGVSGAATDCLTKWMRATQFPKAKSETSVSVLVQGTNDL